MANTFYNRSIRKTIVAFGNVFDNITLVRYNQDQSEQERVIVPIAYATKERYVMRLEGDPDLDKKVQITLPRMSFEMNGLSYDSSRKQNTNTKNFAQQSNGSISSQYNPVPYNFDFSLFIYVRNIEDGTQIIEHILPYFTPDYTIKVNMIPEMGIVKELPIVLNSTNYEVEYEGPRENDTRLVIWTLNFTVKGYIFGAVSPNASIIKTSITNMFTDVTADSTVIFNMANTGNGIYQTGEIVYQGYSVNTSTASGRVLQWNTSNNELYLTGLQGNFVSSNPIKGVTTNANYVFKSYHVAPLELAKVVVVPNPTTANANSNYTYTTTVTEFPRI
jgi:hypothetical protein